MSDFLANLAARSLDLAVAVQPRPVPLFEPPPPREDMPEPAVSVADETGVAGPAVGRERSPSPSYPAPSWPFPSAPEPPAPERREERLPSGAEAGRVSLAPSPGEVVRGSGVEERRPAAGPAPAPPSGAFVAKAAALPIEPGRRLLPPDPVPSRRSDPVAAVPGPPSPPASPISPILPAWAAVERIVVERVTASTEIRPMALSPFPASPPPHVPVAPRHEDARGDIERVIVEREAIAPSPPPSGPDSVPFRPVPVAPAESTRPVPESLLVSPIAPAFSAIPRPLPSGGATPAIAVTIGRIEVRATPPASSPARRRAPGPPALSLEDYLRQRDGRGGR